jgi:hypothetical protein
MKKEETKYFYSVHASQFVACGILLSGHKKVVAK